MFKKKENSMVGAKFNMAKISVIIPVFNSERTIKECLHSVCRQSYKNLEIIVVYLESNDNTLEEIKSVNDERIKIVFQKDLTGPGGARNIGIEHASGEWLGFVEADDVISQDFYEKLMQQTANNDAEIICGEIMLHGKKWEKYKSDAIHEGFENKYNLIRSGASFNKILKTDFVKAHNIKFAEKIRWEDNIFIFKAFYFAKAIRTTPSAIYYYQPTEGTEEYKNKLRSHVLPATTDIIIFAKEEGLSASQTRILQKKVLQSFAKPYITDRNIYLKMLEIMDYPLFLRRLHWNKRLNMWKKQLKQKILGRS